MGDGASEAGEDMDVVGDAADKEGGAIEASGCFSEEGVQAIAESEVAEEWAAVFGGEDEVDVGGGEGLGHLFERRGDVVTRGGRCFLRNPFGVREYL